MYPTLIQIGSFKIHTYGTLIALGFLVAIVLASREAKRVGEDPEKLLDLAFYMIISAIVGSRLLYILLHYQYYRENPLEIIKVWNGGLVYFGGLVLALIVAIWYIQRNHLPLWKTCDIATPSIAIGQAIGRLGCFFAGCCYGKETTLPLAITFNHPESLARLGVPLHPTQLYSSLNAFFIFLILMMVKKSKVFDGFLLWLYVLLYSLTRFFIEYLRGDPRGFVIEGLLSTSQFIGIILGMISIFMLFYLRARHNRQIRE